MIKTCGECGQKFRTKDGRRRYCYACRPQTRQHRRAYSRKMNSRKKSSVLMISKGELKGWAQAVRRAAVFRSPGWVETWREFASDLENCCGYGPELLEISKRFVRLSQNGFASDELANMAKIFCQQIRAPIEILDTRSWTEIERKINEQFK